MRLLYESELKGYLTQSYEEIVNFANNLILSRNANNWQRVNELSFLLRKNNRTEEAVEISRLMFEADQSMDKLNLYFVAVVDHGSIEEIKQLDVLVNSFLIENSLPYQKHLFATWLKAANRILDNEMFENVYSRIPPSEKRENPYIISQFYVYKNRHSKYEDVVEHYNSLSPNIQEARFVKKYYQNARRRMGFVDDEYNPNILPKRPDAVQLSETDDDSSSDVRRIFIVYGKDPISLPLIKSILKASNIDYIDLKETVNAGQTIIEKFEVMASQSDYALILCTPEDKVCISDDNGEKEVWYARQNVIFEWGYFTAKLGRENVCLLYQENGKNLELPSDCKGIAWISMDRGTWLSELGMSLRNAGFNPVF